MRKYLIGGMVGFALAFSITAHAEVESMIGKVVQGAFPVKLNGITLQNQAIIVEGTSYLPVRAMGEAIGYKVMFDSDMGIALTKSADAQPAAQTSVPASEASQSGTDVESGYKKISKAVFNLTIDDTVKTTKLSGNFEYIDVNGDQYLSINTLSSVYAVTWSDPLFTLTLNNVPVTSVAASVHYYSGVSAFSYNGTTFVNLSALGLHAKQAGDTLVLYEEL